MNQATIAADVLRMWALVTTGMLMVWFVGLEQLLRWFCKSVVNSGSRVNACDSWSEMLA